MPDQRVLIVDDEQRTLLFLRESLIVSGLNVETACVSSAEAAVASPAASQSEKCVLATPLA